MPDGAAHQDFTFRRAIRGRFAPLIMISGPSGTGKTYSALRLASGMGGPIFVADTDNSRAKLYAEAFEFMHLDLREPFRPKLFEDAALAAQQQKAGVLIVDNFATEWNGPGGILEWHEQELERMAGDNFQRREQLKMVAWGKVKPPHKHMLQRLYQLNMPIILCCAAEKKIAMVKQTEGKDIGKIAVVDQGFQPIGDKDAAYAMTASLLLADVHRPGVPVAIKALLPDLQPIIHLDRPLDEQTGAAIAAWARGGKAPASQTREGMTTREAGSREETSPPVEPPAPESRKRQDDEDHPSPPPKHRRHVDETQIDDGAKEIRDKFLAVADRREYLLLVDQVLKQIEWLKKNRRPLYDLEVEPARKAAWQRTDTKKAEEPKQGDLMP